MVFGINYDEETQESYESVYLYYGKNEKKLFDSGDIIVDFIDMLKFSVDINELTIGSSSFDHFIMDGDTYVGREFQGIEHIVTKDIKTLEELKNYYKSKKGA